MEDETDLIEAFVACGGQADKSGFIDKDLLVDVIKVYFSLTVSKSNI